MLPNELGSHMTDYILTPSTACLPTCMCAEHADQLFVDQLFVGQCMLSLCARQNMNNCISQTHLYYTARTQTCIHACIAACCMCICTYSGPPQCTYIPTCRVSSTISQTNQNVLFTLHVCRTGACLLVGQVTSDFMVTS